MSKDHYQVYHHPATDNFGYSQDEDDVPASSLVQNTIRTTKIGQSGTEIEMKKSDRDRECYNKENTTAGSIPKCECPIRTVYIPDKDSDMNFNRTYCSEFLMPIENESIGKRFSDKTVRRGFLRKVICILLSQLLFTFGVIALFAIHPKTRSSGPIHLGLAIGVGVVTLILSIVVYNCDSLRRKSSHNYFFLETLTITSAIFAGSISALFTSEALLYAIGITIPVSFGLALFTLQPKIKFTFWAGFLVVALILGIICAIFTILVILGTVSNDINLRGRFALGCIGAFLFSIFLIFDIKRIVRGKHKFGVSAEEYVLAVLGIYVDFILFFIPILAIIAGGGGGSSSSSSGDGANGGSNAPGKSGGEHGTQRY